MICTKNKTTGTMEKPIIVYKLTDIDTQFNPSWHFTTLEKAMAHGDTMLTPGTKWVHHQTGFSREADEGWQTNDGHVWLRIVPIHVA